MSYLKLLSVNHEYQKGKPILKNINISADEGEIICLIGSSGCGKSTILKLIAGLENPQSGKIYIEKECVAENKIHLSAEKRMIGIVFQEPSLFPHKKVIDNVIISIDSKITKKERVKCATEMLTKLDMEKYAKCYPYTLSVGQQQKIAIARALVQQAKIMLLDEPFASLDGLSKQQIIMQILPILKAQKITTILVTHDPTEALTIASRIYVMQDGAIVQSGKAKELYDRPQTLFVADFFGKLNCIKGMVQNSMIKIKFNELEIDTSIKIDKAPDKTEVSLYIRPEAFSVAEDGNIEVIVRNIIFLGMRSAVYVENTNKAIYEINIKSNQLPSIGEKISLKLDTSKIFIFEKNAQ